MRGDQHREFLLSIAHFLALMISASITADIVVPFARESSFLRASGDNVTSTPLRFRFSREVEYHSESIAFPMPNPYHARTVGSSTIVHDLFLRSRLNNCPDSPSYYHDAHHLRRRARALRLLDRVPRVSIAKPYTPTRGRSKPPDAKGYTSFTLVADTMVTKGDQSM